MHLKSGELRAYLDQELPSEQQDQLAAHLAACPECQLQLEALSQRAQVVSQQMTKLKTSPNTTELSLKAAQERWHAHLAEKENLNMWKKVTSPAYRPVWAALGLIVILACALAFPQVRAAASNFLGLFRIQQFTVVQVNPDNLPEQLASSSQLEYLLAENVQVEGHGEGQEVASAGEASQLAGIPVRLPASLESAKLSVQPGARVTFQVDLNKIRSVLTEIGLTDIELPDSLDGAAVTIDLPTVVTALSGDCETDVETARAHGYDPDSLNQPLLPKCTALVQMTSPVVDAPADLDIAELGAAFLQVLGMTAEEAAHFSQNIDWATTLVVPIPYYGTSYQDVKVDGANGTLILQERASQYLLMWVKDGIVYALSGQGSADTALQIANSLK
ncbi:MAG: zf-HC2 domain-containing protein [Anaerolineales bacterium]|nr:MAG: zf-HC2 domain-containing protein [Anaerolineales bacterium]